MRGEQNMQARLTQLNYQEILMYLGHRGQECPMELEKQIHRCMEEVTKAAEPRLVYRILPVNNGQVEGFPLEGNDMRELLADCQQAVLMAVTDFRGIIISFGVTVRPIRRPVFNASQKRAWVCSGKSP